MPAIQSPVDGCSYSAPDDLDPVVVAALLNAHTTSHSNANSGGTNQQHMDTDKSDRRKDAKCIFRNEVGHGCSSKLAQRADSAKHLATSVKCVKDEITLKVYVEAAVKY